MNYVLHSGEILIGLLALVGIIMLAAFVTMTAYKIIREGIKAL